MAAASYDILIEQGATYQQTFAWKDSDGVAIDITGYTARMQVRRSRSAETVLLEATTTNGYIVLGDALGTIAVTIPASITQDVTASRGVYDLELVSAGGIVTRLLEGSVEISKEVTR